MGINLTRMVGLEPTADGFEGRRSTIELHPQFLKPKKTNNIY